jgi:hypothetical protein
VFFKTLVQVGYRGLFGVDIGGSESHVADLDAAYIEGAEFLERRLLAR